MKTYNKYKQNLKTDYKFIYSYNTKVAKINHKKQIINLLPWEIIKPKNNKKKKINQSNTTSKHINYVASKLNYEVIK